jgi:hypothetical protein
VYQVSKTSEKGNITALLTLSASGAIAPTMQVFPYKRLPEEIVTQCPDGWAIGRVDDGGNIF